MMKRVLTLSLMLGLSSTVWAMDHARGTCTGEGLIGHILKQGVLFFVTAFRDYQGEDRVSKDEIDIRLGCFCLKDSCSNYKKFRRVLIQEESFKNIVIIAFLVTALKKCVESSEKPFYQRADIRKLSVRQILELSVLDARELADWILTSYYSRLSLNQRVILQNKTFDCLFDRWLCTQKVKSQEWLMRTNSPDRIVIFHKSVDELYLYF